MVSSTVMPAEQNATLPDSSLTITVMGFRPTSPQPKYVLLSVIDFYIAAVVCNTIINEGAVNYCITIAIKINCCILAIGIRRSYILDLNIKNVRRSLTSAGINTSETFKLPEGPESQNIFIQFVPKSSTLNPPDTVQSKLW